MGDDEEVSGGFGWGLLLGAALGLAAGAYLASGPGRDQVEGLRARTIELTGTARRAASDPQSPMRKAVQDGINAARRRRQELEAQTPGGYRGGSDGTETVDA
jgi:hypothetical protein